MAKGKGRKGKLIQDEKAKELKKFLDGFRVESEELETRLNNLCNETCSKIRKMYEDKLKVLPENIRNMSLTEYMQYMEAKRQEQLEASGTDLLKCRSQYEKQKLESEKKKTLKMKRSQRKRSLSCSSVFGSTTKSFPSNLLASTRLCESQAYLNTPLSKRSVAPSCVITPKFNPKMPLVKGSLRRPRAGELVMSLSGSPLHNLVDDIPEKPGVSVSLGGGKLINITRDTEIGRDFLKKLDQETKSTLANVKEALDKILQG